MAMRYFVQSDESENGQCHELNDVERLIRYMHDIHEGKFFVNKFQGIQIEYNALTGVVKPVSTQERVWITYVFSTDAFRSIIYPIEEAIHLLAKLNLLLSLAKLDPAINGIIQDRHLDVEGKELVRISEADINYTMRQVLKLVSPTAENRFFGLFGSGSQKPQPPLYQAIAELLMNVDSIHTGHDVNKAIEKLNAMENPQKTQAHR